MKQSKMCSGRGFDSRPVHHKPICRPCHAQLGTVLQAEVGLSWAGSGFDRARSSRVDSGVGDDPKSSKTINANDEVFALAA